MGLRRISRTRNTESSEKLCPVRRLLRQEGKLRERLEKRLYVFNAQHDDAPGVDHEKLARLIRLDRHRHRAAGGGEVESCGVFGAC